MGVNGQLHHDVMNELKKRGHEGVGSDIAPVYAGVADDSAVTTMPYVCLDITDKIPVNSQDNVFLERSIRIPTKVILDFRQIDNIVAVMAEAILPMLDESLRNTAILQSIMRLLNDRLINENVGALVVTTHVLDFANLTTIGHHINCFTAVLHIQPVTNLFLLVIRQTTFNLFLSLNG